MFGGSPTGWATEAVHHHAGRLLRRQRAGRADARERVAGCLPLRLPVHRRHGYRRRVRRDQLRHRRAHPGALPRPRRHHGQRDLLVRRVLAASEPSTCSTSSPSIGWRLAFFIGPLWARRSSGCAGTSRRARAGCSPTGAATRPRSRSPSWSTRSRRRRPRLPPVDESKAILVKAAEDHGYHLLRVLFREYPPRSVLGPTMMVTQSFLYNAIFFTATLVLTNFYGVSKDNTSLYFLPFALGNLLGPLLLGHFFDTIGRRKMISGTYATPGSCCSCRPRSYAELLNATTHTIFWCVVFFFASAGAVRRTSRSARSSRSRSGPGDRRTSSRRPVRRGDRARALRRAHRGRQGPCR